MDLAPSSFCRQCNQPHVLARYPKNDRHAQPEEAHHIVRTRPA